MAGGLGSALLTGLVASGVIFLLAAGWVAVDRLFFHTMIEGVDACDRPRTECAHCAGAGRCTARDGDEAGTS